MPEKRAWATLLTRPSYLAGAVILAHTLQKHRTKYPLVVLVTETLSQECIDVFHVFENAVIKTIDPLIPEREVNIIAQRFEDTWTKLRVFSLLEYDKIVFLDADIMIMGEMDSLFDTKLPSKDWLGANHACVCNIDKDPWAPPEWTPENCPWTSQHHPESLHHGPTITPESPPPYHLMNSGVFIFHPSANLWERIQDFLNTTPLLSTFTFPDQHFLDEFFRHKWISIPWQWNATKTRRYWHPNIWRDDEVRALHYIVDKPWEKRVGPDGVAGYKGRDGVTHRWWWDAYEEWERVMQVTGDEGALDTVGKHVAAPIRPMGDGPRPKPAAEKGHGPVVHMPKSQAKTTGQ